jgi:hypothetical protein
MPYSAPKLHSAPSALWCPICLMAPHMPFWRPHMPYSAPYAFLAPTHALLRLKASWRPICLMAPHMPYGAPYAFLVPHRPYGTPSAFLAPLSAFQRPICLLQAPSAFWLPKFFLKRPMTKCLAAKRGPDFNSHPRVQFVDDIIIMCNSQSALPTASAIFCSIFPMG